MVLSFVLSLAAFAPLSSGDAPLRWWTDAVATRLKEAGKNRPQLDRALAEVPRDQRAGLAFLLEHMPERDLRTLSAEFLLTNVDLAYRAKQAVPWGKDIPEDLFLNDVLPYANLDETREPWRREFFEMCLPLVKDCRTPAEAAAKLNAELFGKIKVRYSTKRQAPNQSPKESMALGLASCTGLSILLSDACRSVCIPARLVGTPLWSNGRGNHTWVEIWDRGWHFTGACEPDPNGLNRGWFVGEASRARKDSFLHAIYAASFRRTDRHFPLVWAMKNREVPGENVTDRYTLAAKETNGDSDTLKALRAALAAHPKDLAALAEMEFARQPLSKAEAAAARRMIWEAHADRLRRDRAQEMKDRVLKDGDLTMPFAFTTFGKKPDKGRSLWISLHGGGGAPKQVNDQQWNNQKRLYQVDEGIYLAPRAPTNTWNLWHQPHIDRLFARLIENLIVFEDVDPDRVYLLGYSAGGDGVYQMAPRMADRWAAAAMMAGHPNGVSLLSLRNVPFALQVGANDAAYNRNKVGREYGDQLARLHQEDPGGYEHFVKIHEGRGHWMNLEDRAALPWMAKFTRDPVPTRVVWMQTGTPHERSYWLAVPPGTATVGSLVTVERKGQRFEILAADKVQKLLLRLDDRMVDLDRPIEVMARGKQVFAGKVPRTTATLLRTLPGRGDPRLMFAAEVTLDLDSQK